MFGITVKTSLTVHKPLNTTIPNDIGSFPNLIVNVTLMLYVMSTKAMRPPYWSIEQ